MFTRFSQQYKSVTSLLYVRLRSLLVRHGFGNSKCLTKKGNDTARRSQPHKSRDVKR